MAEFLALEREAIVWGCTVAKVAMAISVAVFFVALGAPLWHRAWWIGVLLLGLAALGKVLWSFSIGDDSARGRSFRRRRSVCSSPPWPSRGGSRRLRRRSA